MDMHSNASAYLGRICLNKNLLETFKDQPDEILAVLCHEFGHTKLNHLLKNTVVDMVYMLIFRLFLQVVMSDPNFLSAMGFEHKSLFATIALAIKMFQGSLDLFLRCVMNSI